MKRGFILLLVLLTTLLIYSCKSDQSPITEELTDENVEEIAENLIAEELAMEEEMAEETEEVGAVANEVEVELEEITIDKEKVKEQKREILTEQLKGSPNLGKDCESIITAYSELVDKYISGVDKDAVIKKLAEWANDPIYNKCKKNDLYKDKFYELEEKMYADEEEEF